ncbi:hypothetical protein F5887DRAFT_505130 [Amanita rubescens]|nr:hypothetical protein F5887DRAFT_505130 [Amanita rubescens]
MTILCHAFLFRLPNQESTTLSRQYLTTFDPAAMGPELTTTNKNEVLANMSHEIIRTLIENDIVITGMTELTHILAFDHRQWHFGYFGLAWVVPCIPLWILNHFKRQFRCDDEPLAVDYDPVPQDDNGCVRLLASKQLGPRATNASSATFWIS